MPEVLTLTTTVGKRIPLPAETGRPAGRSLLPTGVFCHYCPKSTSLQVFRPFSATIGLFFLYQPTYTAAVNQAINIVKTGFFCFSGVANIPVGRMARIEHKCVALGQFCGKVGRVRFQESHENTNPR